MTKGKNRLGAARSTNMGPAIVETVTRSTIATSVHPRGMVESTVTSHVKNAPSLEAIGHDQSAVAETAAPDVSLPTDITNTFVNTLRLKKLLTGHPDQDLVHRIINGFNSGFELGFRGTLQDTFPKNNKTARDNPEGVSAAIAKEVARGHTAGPFHSPPFPVNHISPLGAAPKSDGTVRLIMDLSQPEGASVNDFISKEEFPTNYTPFDEAVKIVRRLGKGCFLSKIDIKHAYRLLPVRKEDWPLLVYFWEGAYYVDLKLPFGCRSSSSIFTDFADLVCWILNNEYDLIVIHYSDDYLLFTKGDLALAKQHLDTFCKVFDYLNIPIALDKLVGPTTRLIYLGIVIDTLAFTLSVPAEKMDEILQLLPKWRNRRTATKQQLLSLIGKLHSICLVVKPGRLFLRRLIDLSTTVKKNCHHINLDASARADMQWWQEWLPSWDTTNIIPESTRILSTDLMLHTDASFIGLGAIYGNAWIQARWNSDTADDNIDFLELFAIMAATYTWGTSWAGKRIVFLTDNEAITKIWQKGSTPSKRIMHLVRKLFLFAVDHHFSITFKHIYGKYNPIADALSRFQENRFRMLAPQANRRPSPIPEAVWDLAIQP